VNILAGRKVSRRKFIGLAGLGAAGVLGASIFVEPLAGYWRRLWGVLDRMPYLKPAPPAPEVPGQSAVFQVDGVPKPAWETPYHAGVDALLTLMDEKGLKFFRSSSGTIMSGPEGIVASSDVVLLKINSQWKQRGMTNTDVIRGLVQRIVDHPDGFTGEVVIVENGQEQDYLGSANENNDDTPDHSQSVEKVVAGFPDDQGYGVSIYNWRLIGRTAVEEWNAGDGRDGYVLAGEYPLNYPKFTTARGTRISLRHGIWTGNGYDNSRLKFLNVPVLKAHVIMGTTGAMKHFAGVMSRFVGEYEPGDDWDFHDNFYRKWKGRPAGLLGRLMAFRFPDLNILDAIYVNPHSNWAAWYDETPRVGALLASTDPVALDYYAARKILLPLRKAHGSKKAAWSDPDIGSVFRRYLVTAQAHLLEARHMVRLGEESVALHRVTV
jgi:uncharacterized protein (DUF362 family)